MRNLLSLLFAGAVMTVLACGSNGPTASNLVAGPGASPDLSSGAVSAFPAISPAGVTIPKQLATKATIQSSATAPGANVLILVDTQNAGTTALVNRLTSEGYNVTQVYPEYTWNGTNPALTNFQAVIHLDGYTYWAALPVAGQLALEQFVNDGGGYISSQWNGYERATGQQVAMPNLVLQLWANGQSDNSGGRYIDYTTVAGQSGHPVLAGIPNTFNFYADGHDAGNQVIYATNPSTVLMRSPSGGPAVLVREYGAGQVVNFSFAANYFNDQTLQNANIQQLYLNALGWAGGDGGNGDTTPPVITLNGAADITLECGAQTYVEPGATATDDVDGAVAVAISGSVDDEVGTYTITYSAEDAAGNAAQTTRTVHVVDTTRPVLSFQTNTGLLWPPNHSMIMVASGVSASDACDENPGVAISITSNEPINGLGDGDTGPDWNVVNTGNGSYQIYLRAERAGNGSGRVYTIQVTATDASGNASSASATVSVPKSQKK